MTTTTRMATTGKIHVRKYDCTAYFDNFKRCKKFWNAVQEYRCMHLKKKKNDLMPDKEMELWKAQLPEWLLTEKLKPVESLLEEK